MEEIPPKSSDDDVSGIDGKWLPEKGEIIPVVTVKLRMQMRRELRQSKLRMKMMLIESG